MTTETLPCAQQQELIDAWFPGWELAQDHSWGLMARAVLEITHEGARFIVKAGGPADGHMRREIRAHQEWLDPWLTIGCAPGLVRADRGANLLVTRWLPGSLVQGSPAADDPDTFEQAGRLLGLLHQQTGQRDDGFERRENAKALRRLDTEHRVAPETVARLRDAIGSWSEPPVQLVPTHGDWQPRNWLVHEGAVSVIDFGRADLRPALTDFTRVAAQDFLRDPALEVAFLAGYGSDAREPEAWFRNRAREAIGTATWTFQIGDEEFERQGHRMVADVLAEL